MSKTLIDVLDAVTGRLTPLMRVYDRDPDPSPSGHYWTILAVDGGNLYSQTLDDRREGHTVYFRPLIVGDSPAACLSARQQVMDSLEGADLFTDEQSASRVEEEETSPPMLAYKGVAGQERWSVTPTYKIRFDRQ